MLVKDVMSERIIAVSPDMNVQRAVEGMVEFNISGIAVQKDDKLCGMITMRDIFKKVIVKKRPPEEVEVKEIMTSPVMTIHPLDTVEEAASIMETNKIRRLLVVNSKERPVGIITAMDIVNNTPEMLAVMFDTWIRPIWRN